MKLTTILFFIAILVVFKLLFALLFFIFSPMVFLSLVGISFLAKAGIFSRLFRAKAAPVKRNEDVVIEIDPINID